MSGDSTFDGWLAVCGLKREAAIWTGGARGGRALVGGGRSDLLRERVEAAIAEARPAGLISFGVAGALRAELKVGDAVVGTAVTCAAERWTCDPEAAGRLQMLTGGRFGEVVGVEAVATDAGAKRTLASGGAAAVDMESAVAARAALRHSLPLAVLRVISDRAEDAVPPAAVAGMRADGGVDVPAVLAALARRPHELPALIRMAHDSGRAFRRLTGLGRDLA